MGSAPCCFSKHSVVGVDVVEENRRIGCHSECISGTWSRGEEFSLCLAKPTNVQRGQLVGIPGLIV